MKQVIQEVNGKKERGVGITETVSVHSEMPVTKYSRRSWKIKVFLAVPKNKVTSSAYEGVEWQTRLIP